MPTKRRRPSHDDTDSAEGLVAGHDDHDDDGHDHAHDLHGFRNGDGDHLRRQVKRSKGVDIISFLSDELLVRILALCNERTLLRLSPVSKRFHRLAGDSQLWRPHYYHRFILPRAHRIPGFRTGAAAASSKLRYSAQRSAWADGGWGRRGGLEGADQAPADVVDVVDWKKQYKLRHNWTRGRCALGEMPVRDMQRNQVPDRQTLVKVVDGLAVTADGESGLRVWDLKTRRLIVEDRLETDENGFRRPTCLAVDHRRLPGGPLDISAGFEDGTFGIWRLDPGHGKLVLLCRQAQGYFGELVAVAYGHPFVLTATRLGFVSLYTFATPRPRDDGAAASESAEHSHERRDGPVPRPGVDLAPFPQPRQLTSLKSHSTRAPLALSIRTTAKSVVASIAYTFDTVGGWSIGIQDLDIRPSGLSIPDVVSSRVASTLPTQTRRSRPSSAASTYASTGAPSRNHLVESDSDGPIRLCYSHPYLLATLPDNTLVLHLCTSTATSLSISPGIRLWGHTSGISDAEITPRGKAVSVSTRGDEIRLWELEGRVGGSSVEVKPRHRDEKAGPPTGTISGPRCPDPDDRKNWVGFDDEMVVVLKEARDGRESLMVYDFT
ncbi:F-box domain containing protein [Drechmeria coniospora]|uniref:F-box domain containing protein n=1 Tax=Drechmeria coniospora TaxID=98403 RepID=A0A151GNU2_DRECN|nr:F-box domain containing protein [Drechmeria coniospora]KYK58784.1 F-box domain containing protein [Drechmeria coniospora]